jgi:hypothetical protein
VPHLRAALCLFVFVGWLRCCDLQSFAVLTHIFFSLIHFYHICYRRCPSSISLPATAISTDQQPGKLPPIPVYLVLSCAIAAIRRRLPQLRAALCLFVFCATHWVGWTLL